MTFKLAERVRETSTTTGVSDLALAGAVSGFRAFSFALSDGDTTWYSLINGSQWETGVGTYQASGNVLRRTTVLESSNSNAKVNLSVGTKDVYIALPAIKAQELDAPDKVQLVAGNLQLTANRSYRITSGTAATLTLPAAPVAGDVVRIIDGGTISPTVQHIIARNGKTIMGKTENLTLDVQGIEFALWYNGTDWRLF